MSDTEQWRSIPEGDHRYSVSDLGRVRGASGIVLKPTLMRIGYLSVAMSLGNYRIVRRYVHRLVAEAFLGPNADDRIVNHRNHEKLDNRATNLELIDRSGNAKHWAAAKRSVSAGRKRTGFCGRGHRFDGNRVLCATCRRLSSAGEYDQPPEGVEWRPSVVPAYLVSADGRLWSTKTKRVLRAGINGPGYAYFNIRVDGTTKPFAAHRLVAVAFLGTVGEDKVVDHIDGDKLNNTVANLQIASRSANTVAFRNRMRSAGRHGYKLTDDVVTQLKAAIHAGDGSTREIAERFDLSLSHVRAIRYGRAWAHVAPSPSMPRAVDDMDQ